MIKAVTSMEKATEVLIKFLKECDADTFCAVFDYTFGTESRYDPSSEEVLVIEPGAYYGGILEEFRGDVRYHIDL